MELVNKKNVTSPIWQFFGFKPDEKGEPKDITQAICKVCMNVVSVKESQTTNLFVHLRTHHPAEAAKLAPKEAAAVTVSKVPTQQSIVGAFAKSTKYKQNSERWARCTAAVSKYIAKEMVSYHTVEKESFKELLKTFDKQYELPGRKYFAKTAIPDLYNKTREIIAKDLKVVDFVALTTDMWSSINMTPYMAVTVHYISEDWKLHAKCLETTFIPENHTADVLSEALKEVLLDWGIEETKISCITTDNGANIVAAIRGLKWPWLNCFGHNLNVAVNYSLQKEKPKTDRAFGICRSINGAFSHSWQRRRELRKAQEQLNLPQTMLITDCATRWGSTYAMIIKILEQLPAIKRVFADDKSRRTLPNVTWQDIAILEAVKDGLKPVAEFTDILSAENYVTVSSLLPMLRLMTNILKEETTDVKMTAEIKKGILQKLDSKYDDSTLQLLRKATLLDPRYKVDHIDAEHLDVLKSQLEVEMVTFWKEKNKPPVRIRVEEEEEEEEKEVDEAAAEMQPAKRTKTLGRLLGKIKQSTSAIPADQRAKLEITSYLQEEVIDGDDKPLEWWKENGSRFPLLANMARKYLCITATSTPSERVFSAAGNIVTPHRNLLKPERE
nr:E3 SUMO-protein ligase ZBED1 [Misgurnus anguillicaudatus]